MNLVVGFDRQEILFRLSGLREKMNASTYRCINSTAEIEHTRAV